MPDAKTIITILVGLILSGLTWFNMQLWNGEQKLRDDAVEIKYHMGKVDDAIEALTKNTTTNTKTTDMLANITAKLAERGAQP